MYFRVLHDDSSGAASYLLADLDGGEAVLVDPRDDDLAVLAAMLDERRLQPRWVLFTHRHEPGPASRHAALQRLGGTVVQRAMPGGSGALLAFGHEHLQVLATPGHTTGCLSYLWRDRLFCGDLLAPDGCPRQPWPQAPEALWDSVTRLVFTLPAETLLFDAHPRRAGAVSSVLEQRRGHPWFGAASRDEFLARARALAPRSPHAPTPAHRAQPAPFTS